MGIQVFIAGFPSVLKTFGAGTSATLASIVGNVTFMEDALPPKSL